jgi:hypothetical protein
MSVTPPAGAGDTIVMVRLGKLCAVVDPGETSNPNRTSHAVVRICIGHPPALSFPRFGIML